MGNSASNDTDEKYFNSSSDDSDYSRSSEGSDYDDDDNSAVSFEGDDEEESDSTNGQLPANANETAINPEKSDSVNTCLVDIDERIQNSDLFEMLIDTVAVQKLKSISTEEIVKEYFSRRATLRSMPSQDRFDSAKYTNTAMDILQACPDINNHRFKLVPARMKEHVFWYIIFCMVLSEQLRRKEEGEVPEETPEDQNAAFTENEETFDRSSQPATTATATVAPTKPNAREASTSNLVSPIQLSSTYSRSYREVMTSGTQAAVVELHQQLKEKNVLVANLKGKLRKAQDTTILLEVKVSELEQRQQLLEDEVKGSSSKSLGNSVSCDKNNKPHSGAWIMEQDSTQFLALDEEIKQQMRLEKERRLKEVSSQMKFILDTDDISDSFGEWDCCKATKYEDECCAK